MYKIRTFPGTIYQRQNIAMNLQINTFTSTNTEEEKKNKLYKLISAISRSSLLPVHCVCFLYFENKPEGGKTTKNQPFFFKTAYMYRMQNFTF